MALADRHLARGPGLSERPAGGVAARRRDRPGLRPGPGRRREGQPFAAWLAAAHCPIVTRTGSAGPGLPDSGGQPCVSKGLRNFVVCQKLSYIIMQGPGPPDSELLSGAQAGALALSCRRFLAETPFKLFGP